MTLAELLYDTAYKTNVRLIIDGEVYYDGPMRSILDNYNTTLLYKIEYIAAIGIDKLEISCITE